MFKDLKEYQEITQLYYDSVNISEEQRAINKIFIEEGFTLEEIEYLEENFDELWENELSGLTEECILESIREDNLTEEQLNEVLGLKMAAKLAKKAAPMVKKGIKAAKTGVKDTLSGAKEVAKSAIKKVGKVVKKAAPVLKKIPGIALPVAAIGGVAAGINKLRNIGKDKREAENKKTETTPPPQIGGGNAGGSTDSGGTAGGDKGGEKQDPPKQPDTPKQTETKKKMSSIEKKNRARFGDKRVDMLKAKQTDFKAMRKGTMSKDDFIKKYPKSITAQKAAGLRDHTEWDAYDMVLEYLFSTEQVSTIEEANYVMMEMDQETIGSIVSEVKYVLDEGFVDNLKAGINKVKTTAGNVKDKVVSKGKEVISNVKNKVDVAKKTLNPASKENKKIREKQAIQKDDSATTKEKRVAKSQESAYKRQRSNKSIADVKAENKAKMIAAAKARNEKFQKDKMKK
jgi:hypothetical protein